MAKQTRPKNNKNRRAKNYGNHGIIKQPRSAYVAAVYAKSNKMPSVF